VQRISGQKHGQLGRAASTKARYSTGFIYEMRRILKAAQVSGEDRINDVEQLLDALTRDRKFVRYVETEIGAVDSYSLILGSYLYPQKRFLKKTALASAELIGNKRYSTIHALLALREWMNRDYYLCAAHAVEALSSEKFESEHNAKPSRLTDEQIKKALSKEKWKRYYRSLSATDAAQARHAKTTHKIKAKAIELYSLGKYQNPHEEYPS